MTQQPKTPKSYTESKAIDCTLQLDIIKKLFFLKNVHNVMKFKILNFKNYDEQFNIPSFSIKKIFR